MASTAELGFVVQRGEERGRRIEAAGIERDDQRRTRDVREQPGDDALVMRHHCGALCGPERVNAGMRRLHSSASAYLSHVHTLRGGPSAGARVGPRRRRRGDFPERQNQ